MIRTGNKTVIKFLPPFDTVLPSGIIYTVVAENTYEGYRLSNNMDSGTIATTIYAGVTDAADVMKSDISKGSLLLTLMNEEGGSYTVPSLYVKPLDNVNNIAYIDKTVAVGIGAHKDDIDLTEIIRDIKGIIEAKLGVTPNIEVLNTSRTVYLTTNKHQELVTARKVKMSSDQVAHLSNQALRDKVTDLSNKVNKLEQYIQKCL